MHDEQEHWNTVKNAFFNVRTLRQLSNWFHSHFFRFCNCHVFWSSSFACHSLCLSAFDVVFITATPPHHLCISWITHIIQSITNLCLVSCNLTDKTSVTDFIKNSTEPSNYHTDMDLHRHCILHRDRIRTNALCVFSGHILHVLTFIESCQSLATIYGAKRRLFAF